MNRDELRKRWGVHSTDPNDKEEVPSSASGSNDNVHPPSPYFATEPRHEHIVSLKLIRRDGEVLYLPYSHQPVVRYNPDYGISIKTLQEEIRITGRGLYPLADWLGAQRVSWIKQSVTGTDDEKEELFVEGIEFNPL